MSATNGSSEPSARKWSRAAQQELENGKHGSNNVQFETLSKPDYKLSASADGDEAFEPDGAFASHLRVVDMAAVLHDPSDRAARAALAAELGGALADVGFALLVGHGVPAGLQQQAHRRIPAFFQRLTAAEKAACMAERYGAVNQGYFPIGQTSNLCVGQSGGRRQQPCAAEGGQRTAVWQPHTAPPTDAACAWRWRCCASCVGGARAHRARRGRCAWDCSTGVLAPPARSLHWCACSTDSGRIPYSFHRQAP